jgi:hypothetical protein
MHRVFPRHTENPPDHASFRAAQSRSEILFHCLPTRSPSAAARQHHLVQADSKPIYKDFTGLLPKLQELEILDRICDDFLSARNDKLRDGL